MVSQLPPALAHHNTEHASCKISNYSVDLFLLHIGEIREALLFDSTKTDGVFNRIGLTFWGRPAFTSSKEKAMAWNINF